MTPRIVSARAVLWPPVSSKFAVFYHEAFIALPYSDKINFGHHFEVDTMRKCDVLNGGNSIKKPRRV